MMLRKTLDELMAELANRRPIFHSESDFQLELGWLIRETFPNCHVRLEYRLPSSRRVVDILTRNAISEGFYVIELKYLCKSFTCTHNEEIFVLKNQGAQDIRQYDVLKDIERIESLHETIPGARGSVIVLANDQAYWKRRSRAETNAAAFQFTHGMTVCAGVKDWGVNTGLGTKKNREQPIVLRNSYEVNWKPYSDGFQYLHFQV